jgi:hypothetical protein
MFRVAAPLLYLDSSALVKRYVQEEGTEHVLAMFPGRPETEFILSRLTLLEVVSAITRRARQGDLASADATRAIQTLHFEVKRLCRVYDIAGAVVARAESLVMSHLLRAADAIHLATALLHAKEATTPIFASADQALLHAATSNGLVAWDPTDGPCP